MAIDDLGSLMGAGTGGGSGGFALPSTPMQTMTATQQMMIDRANTQKQMQMQMVREQIQNAAQQAQQKYWESQAANTSSQIQERAQAAKEMAAQKQAMAQRMGLENIRPTIQAVADQGYNAATKEGNMGDLYSAAEKYNAIENNMPPEVKAVLSKPATYKNPDTGETLQSNYDPILFKKIADNWATDKNTTAQNVADTKATTQQNIATGNNQTALQVAQINRQARLEATKAAASGKRDNLASMAADAEKRYLSSNDPEDLATVNHIAQLMQSTRPTPVATTVLPGGGLGPAPTAQPTQVPARQPGVQPAGSPVGNMNPAQQSWVQRAAQANPGMSIADIIDQGKKLGKL